MAIDTENKRRTAASWWGCVIPPAPDGAIDTNSDRAQVLGVYFGYLSALYDYAYFLNCYFGIGTNTPTSPMHVVDIPTYANNAAAVAAGHTAGAFYRTGADPDVLCIVH